MALVQELPPDEASAEAFSDDPFARISTKEPAALSAVYRRIPSILSNLQEPR